MSGEQGENAAALDGSPQRAEPDLPSPAPEGDGKPDGGGKPEAAPRPRAAGFGVLRVLRHREYAIFWVGQTVSMVGTWMQSFGQGYVVSTMTDSALALGMVHFAMSIPSLVLMPLGGVAADRLERGRILMYTQWTLMLLAVLMGVLLATRRLELWHVYAISLVTGLATAYELPAFQSFYPQLVEREELSQAVSLNQASFHGSRIIGPAVAGQLVALWGRSAAFFGNAASFLAVIVALKFIRSRPAATGGSKASSGAMMKEGIAYVKERPEVMAALGLTGITTFFIFPNLAVLTPHYSEHVLRVGPEGLSLLMSLSGVGALLGSITLLMVPPHGRLIRIALSAGVMVVTLNAMAVAETLWFAALVFTVQSFALAHSMGLVSTIIQERVPNELRGRVMGLYSITFMGVMPVASVIVPGLVELTGSMRYELHAAGIGYGLGALFFILRLRKAHA